LHGLARTGNGTAPIRSFPKRQINERMPEEIIENSSRKLTEKLTRKYLGSILRLGYQMIPSRVSRSAVRNIPQFYRLFGRKQFADPGMSLRR